MESPAEKLKLALEMADFGIQMKREQLRRAHPDLAESTIDGMLRAWLEDRPGAEFGDAPGRVRRL